MTQSKFDQLADILFEGDVRASDIKTMPGMSEGMTREELSEALIESMKRMGLVKNGKLVDIGKSRL